jgi:hypothetical protein
LAQTADAIGTQRAPRASAAIVNVSFLTGAFIHSSTQLAMSPALEHHRYFFPTRMELRPDPENLLDPPAAGQSSFHEFRLFFP